MFSFAEGTWPCGCVGCGKKKKLFYTKKCISKLAFVINTRLYLPARGLSSPYRKLNGTNAGLSSTSFMSTRRRDNTKSAGELKASLKGGYQASLPINKMFKQNSTLEQDSYPLGYTQISSGVRPPVIDKIFPRLV